jgi:hypothetical protein
MFEAEMKLADAISYYKRAAECYFSEDSLTYVAAPASHACTR